MPPIYEMSLTHFCVKKSSKITYICPHIVSRTSFLGLRWIVKPLSSAIMSLSFLPDRSEQTVQTQIRLLLEQQEQSDQGLHCLQCRLHHLDALLYDKATLFKFQSDYGQFLDVWNFRIFTVNKPAYYTGEQQRLRRACASMQSRQSLRCSLT